LLIGRTIKDVGKDVGRAIPTQTFLETGLKAVMTRELVNKRALNARIRMKIFFVFLSLDPQGVASLYLESRCKKKSHFWAAALYK
jgi:hypothetical protein